MRAYAVPFASWHACPSRRHDVQLQNDIKKCLTAYLHDAGKVSGVVESKVVTWSFE